MADVPTVHGRVVSARAASEVRMDKGTQQEVIADLATVIRMLSLAQDLPAVRDVLWRAAQVLVSADGAALVGLGGGACCCPAMAAHDQPEPQAGTVGACSASPTMRHQNLTVIEDVRADACHHRSDCQLARWRGVAVSPIHLIDLVGGLAIGWSVPHIANDYETGLLEILANATARALESLSLAASFDQRVAERTAALERRASDLEAMNARLSAEADEQRSAALRNRAMSLTDDLTGIANRRGFLHLAEQALATCRRHEQPALVVFVDVDDLKAVNDEQGHDVGDIVLRRVADQLIATIRQSDVAGRWGGDEFVALLEGTDDADRFRGRFDAHVREQNLDVSVGIVTVPPGDNTALSDLLARADRLMYADKHSHRLVRDLPMR